MQRSMERDRKRTEALAQLKTSVEILDLDAQPEPRPPEDNAIIKQEDGVTAQLEPEQASVQATQYATDPKEATASAVEVQSSPSPTPEAAAISAALATKQPESPDAPEKEVKVKKEPHDLLNGDKISLNTKDTAFLIGDDEDEPSPQAIRASAQPHGESEGLSQEALRHVTQSSVDKVDAMDIDPETPTTAEDSQAPSSPRSDPTPPSQGQSPSAANGNGPHVGLRSAIPRVTDDAFRSDLRARQQKIQAMMQARQAAQPKQGPDHPAKAPDSNAGLGTAKAPRQRKAAQMSSAEGANRAKGSGSNQAKGRGAKGKNGAGESGAAQQVSRGGGDPDSSDHDSSDGDVDTDDGLFVSDSRHSVDPDDDGDIGMDDETPEQLEARYEREFNALKAKYEKAARVLKKRTKKNEQTFEEECIFESLEREYQLACRRRHSAMAQDKDDDEDDESEDDGLSVMTGNDVPDSALFADFETRHQNGQQEAEQHLSAMDLDEAEDVYAEFERAEQEKKKRQKAQGIESEDELVGNRRKKRSGARLLPKKRTTSGKTRKSKDNTAKDRVLDKNAKVQKPKAKGGKKAAKEAKKTPMLNLASLVTGDVIRDAAGNAGQQALPVFQHRNRQDALRALVSSLPEEHRRNGATDKRSILSAMQDFNKNRSMRTLDGGYFGLPGMVSSLKPHQLLGTAFMRRRETDNIKPNGGICADQMGLGKTVMMIANIVDSLPPRKKYDGPRTTLIVATNALVLQWQSEIKKHVSQEKKHKLKVMIYRRSAMLSDDPPGIMMEHDVVSVKACQ